MAHIRSTDVADLIDNILPSRDDKKPERGDKPDIPSNPIAGPGAGDLEGWEVSGGEVIRSAPIGPGGKHAFELPHSSIDKRYYCA